MVNLFVDSREDKKILKYLEKEKLDYKVVTLPVGDYFCQEKNFCIERKTITDFIGSYISKHLHEQLENMESNFNSYYLFISGSYNYFQFKKSHFSHITERSIIKMKIHLLMLFPNLRIVEFPNDSQLILGVKELLSYDGSKRFKEIIRRPLQKDDIYLSILCCVPSISLTRAKRIKNSYPSFQLLLTSLEDDSFSIEKVYPKQVKELKNIFL